jgi:hypothetical protein
MKRRPFTRYALLALAGLAMVPMSTLAHDGDALPTARHFPAPGHEQAESVLPGSATTRADRIGDRDRTANAPIAPAIGADSRRLAVPGHPAFGRIDTP